jgi:hypothetical protein
MATYVPGSEQYLPDIKPFTPDYKFLSAVLDTRQDKYNTNWQATNDVYNKVVYAGLSRQDTSEQREQYVNNLAPSLEKIAGMDLSLAQNAQSAKAVFAPFFEDKLIVKDMVKTANYQKQMAYANRLQTSVDFDQRDLWWADGVKELQYRMEDFINMSPDQALDAKLYSYTPDADLGKMADKMLSEMKPPLKMKFDHFGKDPDVVNADGTITKGKVNGDWIITTTNGEAVTGPALAMIQERLQDDPRVQNAYRTQAYVAGRDFAAEGMAAGAFGSVQEGQNAWAVETIKRIEANNNRDISDGTKKLAEQQKSTVRWNNYKQLNGVIPGSDDEKIMKEAQNAFDATSARLQNRMKIRDIAATSSPDLESNLNRAYQLLQLTNMHGDMLKAAKAYSMRDMESTMRVNQYAKQSKQFQYDMAKLSATLTERRKLAFDLQAQKASDDYKLAVLKGEVGDPNDPTLDALGNLKIDFSLPETLQFNEDEDVVFAGVNSKLSDDQNILQEKINAIIGSATGLNASAGSEEIILPVEYIKDGETVTENMSIPKLRSFLSQQTEDENGVKSYVNASVIKQQYDNYNTRINDSDALKQTNIDFVNSGNLDPLLLAFNRIDNNQAVSDLRFKKASEIQYKASIKSQSFLEGKDLENSKSLINAGFGQIWEQGESGLWTKLTKKQYVDRAIDVASTTGLENVNLKGFDFGTNAEGYMVDANFKNTDVTEYINYIDTKKINPNSGREYTDTTIKYSKEPLPEARFSRAQKVVQYTDDSGLVVSARDRDKLDFASMRKVKVLDKNSVKLEAEKAYDILSDQENEVLKGNVGAGEIQVASYDSLKKGVDNNIGDLQNYPAISLPINSEVKGKGDQLYADMLNQIKSGLAKGTKPTLYITELENAKEEGAIAQAVLDDFGMDWYAMRSNSKVSTNIKETPKGKIVYANTWGDPEDPTKTKAAYQFFPSAAWQDSKVKGGGGDSQWAGLPASTRKKILDNGITLVFDQDVDISEGSRKSQTNNNSKIAALVDANNGYYSQKVPGEKGDKGGSYSFQKINSQTYTLNYEVQVYKPSVNGVGGKLVPNNVVSRQVNINPRGSIYGGNMSILEKMEQEVINIIKLQAAQNTNLKKNDVAVNGKK